MKHTPVLALFLLVSSAMGLAVRNTRFQCPTSQFGGCCASIDANNIGHECQSAGSDKMAPPFTHYWCSGQGEKDSCCYYARYLVNGVHPLICVVPSIAA
ncbi:uncharacterized protein L3040_004992 [Drepanopeziza brunnea f. sp. 'multigermtubi']|uniref:uncharacterized protein n=1 Tax=Drepanopeziza brunnea f. sp. 'multigermtubi' TaxID=698441 RepID=UPI002397F25C|nr:hypothetical protein L3040_004992 [Drepanopeziza brunnea f. sp. 'multigermtubi']